MKKLLLFLFLIPNLAFSEGVIHKIKGEVYVNGSKATKDYELKNGDKIETRDGLVTLLFEDEIYKLRSNTVFILPDNEVKSPSTLIKGAVIAAFKKKGERKMKIHNTATLSIRGTGVYVKNIAGEKKRYCLCYGKSALETDNHLHSANTESKYHEEFIISSTGKIRKFKLNEFEMNHYSLENIELEKVLGNETPFKSYYRNIVAFFQRSPFIVSFFNI